LASSPQGSSCLEVIRRIRRSCLALCVAQMAASASAARLTPSRGAKCITS
jgi:hypothetical protein